MTDLKYLQNVMNNAEDPEGDHEASYLMMWLIIRDNFAINDASLILDDIRYINNGNFFAEVINEDNCLIEENDRWYWHIAEIIKGEYPLEKLPEHVRDSAQKLYYRVTA